MDEPTFRFQVAGLDGRAAALVRHGRKLEAQLKRVSILHPTVQPILHEIETLSRELYRDIGASRGQAPRSFDFDA